MEYLIYLCVISEIAHAFHYQCNEQHAKESYKPLCNARYQLYEHRVLLLAWKDALLVIIRGVL